MSAVPPYYFGRGVSIISGMRRREFLCGAVALAVRRDASGQFEGAAESILNSNLDLPLFRHTRALFFPSAVLLSIHIWYLASSTLLQCSVVLSCSTEASGRLALSWRLPITLSGCVPRHAGSTTIATVSSAYNSICRGRGR